MDINRRTLADLYFGYKAAFQRGLRSQENAELYRRIATLMPSMAAGEVYPWLGQWPKMREWLDERSIKQLKAHRYEVLNKDFESTVEVERNAISDDMWGVYEPMFEEMGVSAAEWPNDIVFALLKAGEEGLGYDGVPFFSANHPHKIEGTVSNLQTGTSPAWYLLDDTRALKPLLWQLRQKPKFVRRDREEDEPVFMHKKYQYGADARGNAGYGLWQLAYKSRGPLDDSNYKSARQAMMELTNDEGSDLKIKPSLLLVPPELEFDAKQLVAATLVPEGGTNVLVGTAEVLVTNLVR